jgi:CubicO group peptidase (beta-lactamase class C family)
VALAWGTRCGLAGATAAPEALGQARDPDSLPRAAPAEVGIRPQKLRELIAFLDAELKAETFPGCALVASRYGKVFLEEYKGTYLALGGGRKQCEPAVSYMLFSFSKGVSATVIATARQEGLLDYDVPVSRYIPEFTGQGKEAVTLRHVLTHAAGIPSAPFHPVTTPAQWDAAIKALQSVKVEWSPGSRTQYHGFGMLVAAEALRRVSKQRPWNTLCRERLFEPLGASSLTFALPAANSPVALTPGFFDSLEGKGGQFIGHPAGGCFGTVLDALRVLNLHLTGGAWQGRTILRPQTVAEMHTVQYRKEIAAARANKKPPTHETWGLGWLLRGDGPVTGPVPWFGFRDQSEAAVFGHAGIDTVIGVASPARQVALMFLTTRSPKNGDTTTRLRNEVVNRMLAAVERAPA